MHVCVRDTAQTPQTTRNHMSKRVIIKYTTLQSLVPGFIWQPHVVVPFGGLTQNAAKYYIAI